MPNKINVILFEIIVVLLLVAFGEFFYFTFYLSEKGPVINQLSSQQLVIPSIMKINPFEGRFSSAAEKTFEEMLKTPGFEFIKRFGTNSQQELTVSLRQKGTISKIDIQESTILATLSDEKGKKIITLNLPEKSTIKVFSVADPKTQLKYKDLKINQSVEMIWQTTIKEEKKIEETTIIIQ